MSWPQFLLSKIFKKIYEEKEETEDESAITARAHHKDIQIWHTQSWWFGAQSTEAVTELHQVATKSPDCYDHDFDFQYSRPTQYQYETVDTYDLFPMTRINK